MLPERRVHPASVIRLQTEAGIHQCRTAVTESIFQVTDIGRIIQNISTGVSKRSAVQTTGHTGYLISTVIQAGAGKGNCFPLPTARSRCCDCDAFIINSCYLPTCTKNRAGQITKVSGHPDEKTISLFICINTNVTVCYILIITSSTFDGQFFIQFFMNNLSVIALKRKTIIHGRQLFCR